ncbi:hypothetical protein [Leptospira interrogans]|uniref:hypothetical protein n=1 Tax=Leptospira interrogans TaxID=173 RepID=UPI000773A0CA|nr:hypothetical protein [Leptospira interrogans]
MQKLNLIYLLLGLCFFSVNCLYSVKPNYTIERFEAKTKPKAEIGFESLGDSALRETLKKEFSKFIDLTEYSETDKDKIQIVLQEYSFPIENDNTYGKIGLFNLCILFPCWKTYQSGVRVEYKINGKTEDAERYDEDKMLWTWLPFVFYNIFTLSSEKDEFEKNNFSRILEKVAPNIAKSILAFENKNKTKIAERLQKQKELSEWEKMNKNSVRDLVHYLQKVSDKEIEKQAEGVLNNLLDKKVQTHLANRYPFIKPYLMNDLIGSNGSKFEYKFYQIFRSSILGKNPETGFKVETNLSQKDEKIVWRIEGTKEILFFYFSPYKKNITLEKIVHAKNGFEETIDSEEAYLVGKGLFGQKGVFDTYSDYPTYEYTDIEFLEKVK